MATLIQIRRDTQANWTTNNPVLALGELAYSTDQQKLKVGDGSSAWSALDYINALPSEITAEISAAIDGVIDAAPGTLDTLNELAAAINDDASFYTTITNSISSSIDALDTDAIEEGSTNLYFTDARALSATSAAYDAAGSASAAESAANSYTDGEISTLDASLKTYADTAESDANSYADGLAVNYDPAGSASTAETNANTYTDGEITTLQGTLESYADQAEADAISTASADATTKANTAESNANTYTDGEISTLDTSLKAYADTAEADAISSANSYTDTEIASLIGGAPELLNTLDEIAAAIADDENFSTTVVSDIAQGLTDAKAYTDTRETAITTAYESYADTAEADAISTASADATSKANTAESNANTYTDNSINALDTDDIEEGATNLYFTSVRAQDATPGRVTASATMPSSPVNGDGWLDTEDGILYIYMSDVDTSQWIQV